MLRARESFPDQAMMGWLKKWRVPIASEGGRRIQQEVLAAGRLMDAMWRHYTIHLIARTTIPTEEMQPPSTLRPVAFCPFKDGILNSPKARLHQRCDATRWAMQGQ